MGKNIPTTVKLAGLLLAIFAAYLIKPVLVNPPSVDPDHPFNTARAFERLERILGNEAPHPVDSDANDAVRARLLAEIEALGFTPTVGDDFHCVHGWGRVGCARLRNVAFWVTEPGPNAVLLLSHYDSVPAGPGASDDGAGVAASLEIASLMKDQTLDRPLLVLMTDGEEPGLMGADLFVEEDPRAELVGAVVNLEARGTSGLATFFQSSRPNGRDLNVLTGTTRLAAASSLNADIYELLPNDTDMTELLRLEDIDAANFAYTGDVAFYHTPGDTLAQMDKRALFHLGASGLAATEAFLGQAGNEVENQYLFVDVLGLFVLKMSVLYGVLLMAFGALASARLAWFENSTTSLLRVLIVPPLALILGLGLAIGASALVGFIRPEASFGSAHPIALRGLHAAAALFGVMIIYTFLTRPSERAALLASAWLWFAFIGLAFFAAVPGSAILFAPSSLVFGIAAIAFLFDQRQLAKIFAGIGATVFALTILPLAALGEVSLLIEGAAPFAIAVILLFQFFVPLIWPKSSVALRSFWLCLLGTGATFSAFFIAALMVPAYSPEAPRALSIRHVQGYDYDAPVWSVGGADRVPAAMNDVVDFEYDDRLGNNSLRQIAAAPAFETQGVQVETLADATIDTERKITLQISAPDFDRLVFVRDDTDTALTGVSLNGEVFKQDALKNSTFLCSGNACQSTELTLRFPATEAAPNMDLYAIRFGLGPKSAALVSARPDWTIPRQDGDYRLLKLRLQLDEDAETAG